MKRELKYYGCGNPYSKYIPILAYFNVNTNLMKSGKTITGDNYVVECYKMLPALRKKILSENPCISLIILIKSMLLTEFI